MPNDFPIRLAPNFAELYPDGDAQATETAMNLVFTAELLVKRVSKVVQPFGLSPASGLVLSRLADSPTPLAPNEIASQLIITRATVTGLIDSLEQRGYVRRVPHPSDRRMLNVEILPEGVKVAARFRRAVHRQEKIWFDALSAAEQQRLVKSLHRLQTTLRESEPPE